MKQMYSDISWLQELITSGVCQMMITPREWLTADPEIDFETGRVMDPLILDTGKFWIALDMVPKNFYFEENPKESKSGEYYEIIAGGLLNTYNYAVQQVLQTLRYKEFAMIIRDKNKRGKIIGDTSSGMKLSFGNKINNNGAGTQTIKIDLAIDWEDPAPFYNPDNTPETLNNFLYDLDGNFLLLS